MAVTADGQRALSGSDDGTVKLWDLESGQKILTLEGHRRVNAVAMTADGPAGAVGLICENDSAGSGERLDDPHARRPYP